MKDMQGNGGAGRDAEVFETNASTDVHKITPIDVHPADAKAQSDAEKEEYQISQATYDAVQLARRLDFKRHVHRVSVYFLYGISSAYGIAALTWMWHLLAPEGGHFMPKENYATLQSLLFGTIIGGLASQFANKVFSK